jgi:hypothetical protein
MVLIHTTTNPKSDAQIPTRPNSSRSVLPLSLPTEAVALSPPNLPWPGCWSWSPLPPLLAPMVARGRGASFLRYGLVVGVRFCVSSCIVGMVGAAFGRINLHHLYPHIGDDLQGGASELMATCADRSFRSAAWSSQ